MRAIDFDAMYELVAATVKSDVDLETGMARVLEACATTRPHIDWARLAELDFGGDLTRVRTWFAQLITEDPPGDEITGLWFGVFNPVGAEEPMLTDVYVTGAVYAGRDHDWTCDPTWAPGRRYARSHALAEVGRIAYADRPDALGNDAEYPVCLAYAALAARDVTRDLAESLGRVPRVIAVGFDAGDVLCLGALDARGLRFSLASGATLDARR